jgi:transposase
VTTKLHLCAEGKARPLSLLLTEGQKADCVQLESILNAIRVKRAGKGRPRKRPGRLLLDRGYTGNPSRSLLRRRRIKHVIPQRADEMASRVKKGSKGGRPIVYEKAVYVLRNAVERCILRLKQFRRVATRYEKRAASFLAMATLASIILWIR